MADDIKAKREKRRLDKEQARQRLPRAHGAAERRFGAPVGPLQDPDERRGVNF